MCHPEPIGALSAEGSGMNVPSDIRQGCFIDIQHDEAINFEFIK